MTEAEARAAIEAGLAALRDREPDRAAKCLLQAIDHVSPDRFPWIALANAEIMRGDRAAAAAVLDRRLSQQPREIAVLLQRGWLYEEAGDVRAAVSFYRAALNQAAANGSVPPPLKGLLDRAAGFCSDADNSFSAQLDEAMTGSLSPAMDEALGLLRGEREIDLQRPSLFYYPGLPQKRFYEPTDFPWLNPMLALLPAMRAEWEAIAAAGASGFFPYVESHADRPAPNNPLLGSYDWTALHFWRSGEIVAENAQRCPATMQALSHAPMPRVASRSPNAHWSRLKPGAHITPHTGMLNTRLICHIPIKTARGCSLRVGSETRTWEDGIPLIFDDSIEHEARNAGVHDRVVLLFEIWRPEVPEEDREAIGRLFKAIGDYGL